MFKIIKEKLNEDSRIFNGIEDLNINTENLNDFTGLDEKLTENFEGIKDLINEAEGLLKESAELDEDDYMSFEEGKCEGKKKILLDDEDFDLDDEDLDDEDEEDLDNLELDEDFDFDLENEEVLYEDLLMDDELDEDELDDENFDEDEIDIVGDKEIQELADEELEDEEEDDVEKMLENCLILDLDI